MKKIYERFAAWLMVALFAMAQPSYSQQDFVLIVNAANPVSSVTREELGKIFLKKTAKWGDGARAEPVDLGAGSPVRARFSQSVHGKETSAVKAYWQKMIFSGREIPPPELGSAAEVVSFVGSKRGGVGYVPEGTELGERVKRVRLAP
jgi:ABC-type phosphate transport system substrate-binding protein